MVLSVRREKYPTDDINRKDFMLKIGDFSKLSRISIRMLRHYDLIGLLVPESIDDFTGYRYYSENQLPLASRIAALKEMGFSLNMIDRILKVYDDTASLKEYLLLQQAELKEQAEKTGMQLRILETTLNRIGKDDNMMQYSVSVKEMPERNVASLRKIIPAYNKEGLLWEQLMKEVTPLSIQYANPCNGLAVFHDKEYKEQDPDVEIQISVLGSYQNTANVIFKTVPSVTIASATYKGGYEQLTTVNHAVADWVRDNGYDFSEDMFTIYHVGPGQTKNPEEFVTEVCFPISKK